MRRTQITGTGRFVPDQVVSNNDFHQRTFYTEKSVAIDRPVEVITRKFQEITGIRQRRWADSTMMTSDLAYMAGQQAIVDSGIDPESLDLIIVAHNFGDVKSGSVQPDAMPSIASRVKHKLGIKDPNCVAYDVIFGCPGWVQGMIVAEAYFKAGMANSALVIGAEMLSRVIDESDRDSMLFSDGAGAVVAEYKSAGESGLISSAAASFTEEELGYLYMDKANHPDADQHVKFIKMNGRKVYEFALKHVPTAMKLCLDRAGVQIEDVKKIFIHQANEKLDDMVLKRLFELYGIDTAPEGIMPMSVHDWGNNSVATVPALYDAVRRGDKPGHRIEKGDLVLFASVGAGMNVNAFCYRV